MENEIKKESGWFPLEFEWSGRGLAEPEL